MTEIDYNIKPLSGLSNILALNAAREDEGRRKRKKNRQQPKGSIDARKNEDSVESGKYRFNDRNENDDDIDYCA